MFHDTHNQRLILNRVLHMLQKPNDQTDKNNSYKARTKISITDFS